MMESYRIGFYAHIDERTAAPEVVEREFSKELFLNMKDKTKILFESQSLYVTWSSVLRNYEQYLAISKSNKKIKMHQRVYLGSISIHSDISDISRTTVNLLATASTYLIVVERLMKNYFGEHSSTYIAWDKLRKDLHAESRSYRICYALRNFSQHYEIPFSGVDFSFSSGRSTGCDPFIDKHALINCGYDWKQARKEIEALDQYTCLSSLLDGYYVCLKQIFSEAHKCFSEKIEESRSCIDEIIRDFGLPNDVNPIVFELSLTESDLNKLNQEYIPSNLLKYIEGITTGV